MSDRGVDDSGIDWVFIETIDTTSLAPAIAKEQFWARHPELQGVEQSAIRMDVICGRDPMSSALRFSVRSDAIGSGGAS
ncbi:MAG: hypothetical protein WAV54_04665 [Acidimicrobiales bacterium]